MDDQIDYVNGYIDENIERAAIAVSAGIPTEEILDTLVDSGLDMEDAFLATMAALIIDRDREQNRQVA
jgi:hypothetical protein